MKEIIEKLKATEDLSAKEINLSADWLLDESADPLQKEEFLEALSIKGETANEITYFVEAFLEHAVDPCIQNIPLSGPTIDVCGTGGDKLDLFNVSTTSMFVIAACGATVVKHGNRGITSKSGGADVLEALGIQLNASPEQFRECIKTAGVGFLFAPIYHPSFKTIGPVRKKLADRGVRTIFNLIGPLLNPARPDFQLVGICEKNLRSAYADILKRLGRKNAWVVHGHTAEGNSVDEVSLMGPTDISKSGTLQTTSEETITPEHLGFTTVNVNELQGGDATVNATILTNILDGTEQGPKRQMVILNAAAGITCAGLAKNLKTAIEMANHAIDTGKAIEKLHLLQNIFTPSR